jgi:hypothetical protein
LQAERLKWDRLSDNDDKWHYNGEQGINVLLRISKILFPNNRVNVPVIK